MARVPVETVLTARDVNTAATLRTLSSLAGGLQSTVSMASRAFGAFNALALGGSIALGAQSLIKVNQELENTTNQLAGNIKVYGYAKDYADSLVLADETLKRIRADAASLPGSDSDFIKAFALTFPAQAELGVRSLELMTKRSNELTAVLLSKGIDANQAGRDLSLMMRGQAGMDVRSFMELKGVMGVKSTDEWNKMSAAKRLAKLDEARGKFGDTIKAFENTWDAVTSTGASYLKNLVTEGSKPLFELAKGNLKAINDYVGGIQPKLMSAAGLLGAMAADATKATGGLALDVGKAMAPRSYAIAAVESTAAPIINTLATVGAHVVRLLHPLGEALSSVGSAIAGVLMPALSGIGQVLEVAVGVTGVFVRGILFTATMLFDAVGPILGRVVGALGQVYTAVSDVVVILAAKVKPYADGFIEVLRMLITKMVEAANWVAAKFGKTGIAEGFAERFSKLHERAESARKDLGMERVDAVGWSKKYAEQFAREREKAEADRQKQLERIAKDAAKNKRPTIHQDFRNSRFDIEQRFAPGFDPGRVLTAMREDAGRMATRRLSSGLTPLFGQTG